MDRKVALFGKEWGGRGTARGRALPRSTKLELEGLSGGIKRWVLGGGGGGGGGIIEKCSPKCERANGEW